MQEETYSLKQMLDTLTKIKNNTVKKRLIFDQSPVGGIGAKWVISFFISLPIILYVGIFNPAVFAMLGIAQAIIFYVIFLSMVMIMIIALTFINNNKVIRQIDPSWQTFFPDVDLKLILSSGASPYKDFFKHYDKAVKAGTKDEDLHSFLQQAFSEMQEENKDLLEAMARDTNV